MFAEDGFRFDVLGAERALPQISAAKNDKEPSNWAEKDRYRNRRPNLILMLANGIANDGVDTTPENNGKNELLVGHASLTRHAACQKRAHFGPSLKSTGVPSEAGGGNRAGGSRATSTKPVRVSFRVESESIEPACRAKAPLSTNVATRASCLICSGY